MNTRVVTFCKWPDCRRQIPPRLFACYDHWRALPASIRRDILRAYVPGQELTNTPSVEYIAAAKAAQNWISRRTPTSEAPPAFHEPKEQP